MKTKALIFTTMLLLAGLPLLAASDIFLKIDTIPGESTSPGHQGWMDLESFSWGMNSAAAVREAANQPRCAVHSLNFTKRLDKASPALAQAALIGLLLPAVTLEVNGERHMLQNVQFKTVQNVNGANGPAQAVSMNFTKCLTHETGAALAPLHKADVVIKMDTNATLAFGAGGPGDAIALQDLHFVGPNQAVLTCRKAGGGTNAILIGLLRGSQTGQHIPEVSVRAKKANSPEYFVVKMSDVLVSSYQSGGGGGAGFDQITLNFAKLDGPMTPFHDVFIK